MDGFVSIERFASMTREGAILSLSFWRDEEAVRAWRTSALHRQFQAQGRAAIFRHYRLRVATVIRAYGLHARAEAPDDSLAAHG